MKILLLIEKFGAVGGAERQVAMLATALAERGHEIRVAAGEAGAPPPGVGVESLGTRGHVEFAEAALRYAKEHPADVVHSFARTLSQDVLRLGGGVHAEYLRRMEAARSPIGRWFSRWNPKERRILDLERRSFEPSASRLIQAVSEQVRDEVVRHYRVDPERIVVTRNAVDTARFHPGLREHRAAVLAELGLPAESFVVLYVGAGFRRKGLDRAIGAMAALPPRSQAVLLVVGGGSTSRYEAQAARLGAPVRFLGSRSDVERCYGAADALVLPTLYDPFPNVTLEAMACGVPVIVTRVAGTSEVIHDGVDSFVVEDPGEPREIAERLARLMRGRERDTMGRAARASAERRPFRAVVDETLALYDRARRLPVF